MGDDPWPSLRTSSGWWGIAPMLLEGINAPAHTSATQQVRRPDFFALRRNWFSQLHFHFSHQSTTELSINTIKYPEYVPAHFKNLINFSVVQWQR